MNKKNETINISAAQKNRDEIIEIDVRNETLMLVDGNSIVNRAYFAFAGQNRLVTKDGRPTNAIYGFLNIFNKYFDEVKPTRVCIAFDMRAPTFRHKEYDAYKAGRKGMPDDLAEQLPALKAVIDALGYRRTECEGYEADDILGTLSKQAEDAGMKCVIVTGDRDSLQLVSQTTRVLLPVTRGGQTRTEAYDEAAMLERYGVTPELFIDVKGLMGDSSDNIPGVAGVGEKTALELVIKHGGIDNIYENLDAIERKTVRAKLEAGKESAYMSRRLATIERRAPCDVGIGELSIAAPDRKTLYKLFTELQFQTYILKMGLTLADTVDMEESGGEAVETVNMDASDDGEADEKIDVTDIGAGDAAHSSIIKDRAEFIRRVKRLGDKSVTGGASDGAVHIAFFPFFDKITKFNTILFGAACVSADDAFYFETVDANILRKNNGKSDISINDVFDAFRPLFSNPGVSIYGHDVKKISNWLLKNSENCPKYGFDTMLGAYMADSATGEYDLPGAYFRFTGGILDDFDAARGRGKSQKALSDFNASELAKIAVNNAKAIRELAPKLMAVISENGQDDLYYNVELPLSEALASMEVAGFKLDVEGLREFSAELDSYINELSAQILALAGEDFNINSTKQLGVILYEKLGLKPVKKTKTGYSTDADALADLSGKHPIVDKITEYRQHVKLRSTYTDGLIELIDPADGRVHTTLNQAVTATGRISSTEPNLQNIPVRLALGREIRRLFIPETPDMLLLGADYSQIELRVLAHLSEDAAFAEAFRTGDDIHRSTAARVFNVPEDEVTGEMRTRAKAVNFGIVYGIGEFSLARDIGVTRAEAREYIDSYLNKYEGVKRYMKDAVALGKELGYSTTLLHRRRSLPELKSSNFNTRAFGERVAMNTPVQGSAADIIKIAMVRAYKELKTRGLKSRLILQVHDELIIEAHANELDTAAAILRESMESAVSLSVPLVADVYYGANWKDIKTGKAP